MDFWKQQVVKTCSLSWKNFSKEQQEEFKIWHYDTNLAYLKIAFLGSIVVTVAVTVFGHLVLDGPESNLLSRWPQLLLLVFQILTLLGLNSKFARAHHQKVITTLGVICYTIVTSIVVHLPSERVVIGYGIIFSLLLVTYGLMRLTMLYATITGIAGSLWFLSQAASSPLFTSQAILQMSAYMVHFNVMGIILAYTLDRVHRQNFIALKQVSREFERAESLLLNILPLNIAERLKNDKSSIADHVPEVTVLFADIVDFTPLAKVLPPQEVVTILNSLFTEFDAVMEMHGVEKIKTIGDAYMAAAGLQPEQTNHAERVALAALDLIKATHRASIELGYALRVRIGINSGAVVAGVIGQKKMIYDLWGDTVNVASRMESGGQPSQIQVSENSFELLKHRFEFDEPRIQKVKGHGDMNIRTLIRALPQVSYPPLNAQIIVSTEPPAVESVSAPIAS